MKQELNFKSFSKAIRQKRIIDLNITGREAAKVIGISYPTLSRVENSNMPDLITYANICKWLGVSMDTFISKAKKIQ
jgi:transcriptional regulator with XRE-family HTH domain